jgi:riboflavin kinase/FMN adenylyltransferase
MREKKRVIALGFFDGVHIGHSALLRRVTEIGEEKNLIPSVITFDTHPLSLISGSIIALINSIDDRVGLIRRTFGIDDIIILRFDKETADMPWYNYIEHLSHEFGACCLVAGYDFKFGNGGIGNSELLKQKCRELGIGCEIIPEVSYNGITCSSTYIRELLLNGDIERAAAFLGHPHVLTDVVRYGYRLGRTLGSPTINMSFQDNVLVPAFGVYATKVHLENGSSHSGITNIGVRPTIAGSDQKITAETHIINYHGSLYGRQVRIALYKLLRTEIKFDSIGKLKEQIQFDRTAALSYFSSLPNNYFSGENNL